MLILFFFLFFLSFLQWKYLLSSYLAEADFSCVLSVVDDVVEHVCLYG